MRRRILVGSLFMCLAVAAPSQAQQVQVSKENRTVDVSVTETVKVDAEVAVIELGIQNYAATHEDAYKQNVTAANRILKALQEAGVPENQIQTKTVQLGQTESLEGREVKQPKERQFMAFQSWTIKVPAQDAQRVIDAAAQAGANEVSSVEWAVKDSKALQAKALEAAMTSARDLAAELAKAMGAKLGQVVYVSNGVSESFSAEFGRLRVVTNAGVLPPPPPNLKLLPQKVEDSATVRAIFAIE
jgi:uncharacterized protein YggE